ncbi:MAG TPA: universal stress protein [Candidatus Omnitrophica bacterium]|nr:universal stress protein [Candidatus Omnitrophota bacterium]
MEEDGKRYLNHIQRMAQEQQVDVEIILTKGEVHREVINKIKELNIDLLIMGELAELASRKDMFYDEAERIFRESPCSVLITKETGKH